MPFISSMETSGSTSEKPAEQWIPLVSGGKNVDEQSVAKPVAETTRAVALGHVGTQHRLGCLECQVAQSLVFIFSPASAATPSP